MQQEKLIRERIKEKVFIETGKKVRNVFFCCGGIDNKNVYCLVGNNNNIFGVAAINSKNEIEVIV